ncbi:PP2C family protein-serine/threonine phosphatase [Crateriforma conspicua]|uniref:PP2C family protein-serine/threonine phosphatase n=1 Tax=Crateriforma conspicua TaxID=2527996 RepID=UPI0018CE7543|nr:protein phosphatase 2C domain-containing protein [Crateriforma conspicua]
MIADLSKSMIVHHSTLIADEARLFSDVQGQLLIVADGMGGHAAGGRASQLTTSIITDYVLEVMPWFLRLQHESEERLHELLKSAVMASDWVVSEEAENIPEEAGMGATLTMAYVVWPRMYVVHVGDSRCYLLRDDNLRQVTRDHTLLRELEDSGCDVGDDQRNSFGSILYNAVGRGRDALSPEVYRVDLRLGDSVLLCSDGLTDMVDDYEIKSTLKRHGSDERAACESLVDAALAAGGRDNVTVIVSRFDQGSEDLSVDEDDADEMADEEDADLDDTVVE